MKLPIVKSEPITVKKEPSVPKRKNASIDSDDDLPLVCLFSSRFMLENVRIFRLKKLKIKQMLNENQIP